ncbi:carotenoid oxygenase family protein [Haladaptatus sp. NG-SE-30]
MATQYPPGFHSLTNETQSALSVDGTLPEWISGTLVRNGPGAFELGETTVDHWFDGFAMLHRFTFNDGITYQNRFLRTDAYAAALDGTFEGGFATGKTSFFERLKSFLFEKPYDNTNVITERVGRHYLALTETPRWVEFDPTTLQTLGDLQYDGPEPNGRLACAHMNRDIDTGSMVNFETEFGRTSSYHVYAMASPTDRDHICSAAVDEPAYMHSFALTPHYVVLTEFPFVVDPIDFLRPGNQDPFIENFEWKPERGTRFLVIDREKGHIIAEPKTDAFFGFHHVNAYEVESTHETDTELVIDLETVPDTVSLDALYLDELRSGDLGVFGGRLERFQIHLDETDSATISREMLYEGGTALPTVSPARWCHEHRYVYAQGTDQPVTEWPRAILKIDTETGTVSEFSDRENHFSEPIFVPRPEGATEDDGVVLTVALDVDAERSWLVVLDGSSFTELARASLPHPIPFDFHGRFFPEVEDNWVPY